MNLYKHIKEKINLDRISDLEDDKYELAIVRMVLKELSKIFYRDYTFFLNKENLDDREAIYNKEYNLSDFQDHSVTCKKHSRIVVDLLKSIYDIDAEIISSANDKYRHIDVLIKTKSGKRYIVDPLGDLIEMQVGLKTNNFASEEYYNSCYSHYIDDISFLAEDELEEIDDKIKYTSDIVYLDEFLLYLKSKLDNIEEILKQNDKLSVELLGEKYDGREFSENERTQLKLKFISKFFNNRKNLKGTVDLLMFANFTIKKIFLPQEQEKISVNSFFVDKKDLEDINLKQMLRGKENRKRGIVISFGGKNYIFALSQTSLEYSDEEWKKIVEKNKIFIRPKFSVQLLKYLKSNGVDRNLVHNNEFLRIFSELETKLLKEGKTLEDIKNNNILIQDGIIFINHGNESYSYRIENGNFVIKDYKNNLKKTVFYKDEGRNISYNCEELVPIKERVFLHEFDSNGLIDLENVSGIEKFVAPLKNGKYLSRNASFYESKTYSELSKERKEIRELLTEELSKKNFVLLEYLANASAKVYFEELKKQINNQDNFIDEARRCFEEDCANIVRFFENRFIIKPKYDLPEGNCKILERHIEMDNKQILYMYCSNLKFKNPKHVLIPGLGSIFVGPMLKSMYGFDYTNILYSLYCKDDQLKNISSSKSFEEICSNNLWRETENELILIDDNVCSCSTMNAIRAKLQERGKKCKYGAIKYNWNFYKHVKEGKLTHPTFDVEDVDFLTVFDDPGYWVMRDSIKALKEEGGDAYIEVMRTEGLRQDNIPDIQRLMETAENYSKEKGIDLYDAKGKKIKRTSAYICRKLKKQILDIIREFKFHNIEAR